MVSNNNFRVEPGLPADEEPKFIVFFSKLLALFSLFCFTCKKSFDSMGHSAKFGAYTMFCNTLLKVIHFEILQV